MNNEVTLDPERLSAFIAEQRKDYIGDEEVPEGGQDVAWGDLVSFGGNWGTALASLVWVADGDHHVFRFPDDLPEMEVAAYGESTDYGDALVLAIRPREYDVRSAAGWGAFVQVATFSMEMKELGLRGEEALKVPLTSILEEVARALGWLVPAARKLLK